MAYSWIFKKDRRMKATLQILQCAVREEAFVKVGYYGLLIVVILFPGTALPLESGSIFLGLSTGTGQWVEPLDEFLLGNHLDLNTEPLVNTRIGQVLVVRIDLNGDGTPEYFVQDTATCGNGGCPYAIFDGRTKGYLGTVFGSEVWLLHRKTHGMPVIESFSHMSAFLANVTTYIFDGNAYKNEASLEIGGEEDTETFYKQLHSAPRFK
jgi:hypothetical protein